MFTPNPIANGSNSESSDSDAEKQAEEQKSGQLDNGPSMAATLQYADKLLQPEHELYTSACFLLPDFAESQKAGNCDAILCADTLHSRPECSPCA